MDEKQKNAVMIATVAACFTIIICMYLLGGTSWYVQYPATLLLAGGIGAGAFYGAKNFM